MKYAVDKIEGNIIVLENIKNNKIKEINLKEVNFEVKESDILVFKNNKYIKDESIKNERYNMLRERLEKLK